MKKTMGKMLLLGLTVLLLLVAVFQTMQIGELKEGITGAKQIISAQAVAVGTSAAGPRPQSSAASSGMVGGC